MVYKANASFTSKYKIFFEAIINLIKTKTFLFNKGNENKI